MLQLDNVKVQIECIATKKESLRILRLLSFSLELLLINLAPGHIAYKRQLKLVSHKGAQDEENLTDYKHCPYDKAHWP